MVTDRAEVRQWKGGSESNDFVFVDFTHVSYVCVLEKLDMQSIWS